ncbi:hypothetical protein ACUXIZ_005062 [Cytobacillus horneckiae]
MDVLYQQVNKANQPNSRQRPSNLTLFNEELARGNETT